MVVLLVLGVLVLLALSWFGVRMLLAGRQLEDAREEDLDHAGIAAAGVARKVDRGLYRTRVMVEELIMPEADGEVRRPPRTTTQERAQTYVVLGVALLGLAASMLIGMLLLL